MQAIYAALTNGVMKSQTSGLSTQEVISLLVYIAPAGDANAKPAFEKSCTGNAPLKSGASAWGGPWGGWSPSVTNSRYQDAKAAGLAAADVPRLKLKWAFNLGAVTMGRGQPAVAGNRVFTSTLAGDVYALDAASGCVYWAFKATAGVRSGVAVGDANGVPAIFFGDRSAVMYALNAESGELLWKTRPVEHLLASSTATPQFYKGVIYQGFSSIEEALVADPNAVCCTFRGSVVALDAATGRIIWESFTIAEPAKPTGRGKQQGPSGVAIWSTPTIDEQKGALYVATGDNYSNPVTETSDAVLAFDLKTGKLLWSRQLMQGDAYNGACNSREPANCPDKNGPDFDFGQPPILVQLSAPSWAAVSARWSSRRSPAWCMRSILTRRARFCGKPAWGQAACWAAANGVRPRTTGAFMSRFRMSSLHSVPDAKAPGGRRIVPDPKKGGGLSCDRPEVGRNRLERQAGDVPRHSGHLLARAIRGRYRHPGCGVFRQPRRPHARLFHHGRQSDLGLRYGPPVPDRQRKTGARRIHRCDGSSRGRRPGIRQLRLQPVRRNAR